MFNTFMEWLGLQDNRDRGENDDLAERVAQGCPQNQCDIYIPRENQTFKDSSSDEDDFVENPNPRV